MLRPNPVLEKPFVATHTRNKGKVEAMLMADRDGRALYRVKFDDVDRITSASSEHFERNFRHG